MEKQLNFVEGGATKLPPGFRFQPTDEEIVFQYLMRKIFSFPLPASVVPEIIVSKYDPWDLPGDGEQDRYFFTQKEAKYQNGNRANRATSSGYWKATGLDKRITSPRLIRKDILGMRKTLVFHVGKPPNGSRTHWIMHEYRLVSSETASCSNFQHNNSSQQNTNLVQMGNWVLCRLFLKKRSTENDDTEILQPTTGVQLHQQLYDSAGPSSSSTSSCGSSVATSSEMLDHEEETSGSGMRAS